MRKRQQEPNESQRLAVQVEAVKQDKEAWDKAQILTLEAYIVNTAKTLSEEYQNSLYGELRNCGEYTVKKLQDIADKYSLPTNPEHDTETYRHYQRGD